jgi:hypothetical protein
MKYYLFIKEERGQVTVTDLETSSTTTAKQSKIGELSFPVPIQSKGPVGTSSGPEFVLKGSLDGPGMSGHIVTASGQIAVKAAKLVSVWSCSSHTDPAHLAKTEEEMRAATAKNNCKGWHKVDPPKD